MNFAYNLKCLRKKYGYSQENLADMLGYSSKNVSKWERGESIPNISSLNDICKLFCLNNLNELLYEKIEYSECDVSLDKKYFNKKQIDIEEGNIRFYYNLLKGLNNLELDIQKFNMDYLIMLKELGVLKEYSVIQNEEKVSLSYSLSAINCKDLSLRSVYKELNNCSIDFASDSDYFDYKSELKLNKQVNIVLSQIEQMSDVSFSLIELYNSSLKDILLKEYENNKDYKKIIRTCISKLVDVGILDKEKCGVYRKKYNKVSENNFYLSEKELADLDDLLQLKFDEYSYTRNYKLSELVEKIKSNDINEILNNYLIHLRNLSLVSRYSIKINNNDLDIEYETE